MRYLIITLFILISIKGFSQSSKSFLIHKPSVALAKILIDKIYIFSDAWGKSDTVTLSKLLAPEYRHSDVFGEIQHRNDWLAFATIKRQVTNLEIHDTEIIMYNNNLAVITGRMNYLFGKEKIKQDLRFTQIWGNFKGEWKRTTFQGTFIKNPK